MTKAEEIVTKVSRDLQQLVQLVTGNGTKTGSIIGRLDTIEKHIDSTNDRLITVESYPCKDGCLFEGYKGREEEVQTRKRTFRIADLANYIQLAILLLIVYGMFM